VEEPPLEAVGPAHEAACHRTSELVGAQPVDVFATTGVGDASDASAST